MPDSTAPLAPCLMVAGTASDVGKSVIATALCAVLAEEGLRVAPFKAQNMSNNAAVTADGGEIARSQWAQAEAAGVEPTVDMNPLLLKPEADDRSQLIVRGKVVDTVTARSYWSDRSVWWPTVTESLERLRRSFDVVVMEGAGSIAELNLRSVDLVNMPLARHADASTILVGDIERGGIFAQLLGTLDLLEPEDRALIKGLIVNRFRGDRSLFDDGVTILEERSGLPVLGVLPWEPDLPVPPEDVQSIGAIASAPDDALVDIAVVAYPRAANLDDLFPLRGSRASVRIVTLPGELGRPDLIVLPGSKATLDDLDWLRQTGLANAVARASAQGTPILGLCGGFQMLGEHLDDSRGTEGEPREGPGLGLLPVRTEFLGAKTTTQRKALATGSSALFARAVELDAYEIHTGRTVITDPRAQAFAELDGDAGPDGAVSPDGLIAGTYLHGLIHGEPARQALISSLARRRGTPASGADLQRRTADLAAWFRSSVDLGPILDSAVGHARTSR